MPNNNTKQIMTIFTRNSFLSVAKGTVCSVKIKLKPTSIHLYLNIYNTVISQSHILSMQDITEYSYIKHLYLWSDSM